MVWVYCGWGCWTLDAMEIPNLRSFRRGFPGCTLAEASVDDASRHEAIQGIQLQLPNSPNCFSCRNANGLRDPNFEKHPYDRVPKIYICYFHRWLLTFWAEEKLSQPSMPSMPGFPSATAPKVQSRSQLAGSGSVQPLHNEVWASAVFWRDPAFCDMFFNIDVDWVCASDLRFLFPFALRNTRSNMAVSQTPCCALIETKQTEASVWSDSNSSLLRLWTPSLFQGCLHFLQLRSKGLLSACFWATDENPVDQGIFLPTSCVEFRTDVIQLQVGEMCEYILYHKRYQTMVSAETKELRKWTRGCDRLS